MRSRSVRHSAIWSLVLCGCLPIAAQHRGYHTELSNGTSGWLALINDSAQPIEAFHYKARCGNGGMGFSHDVLDFPGNKSSQPPVGGYQPDREDIVKPGDRRYFMLNLPPQTSGCAWQGDIDAVIFANGTFDGDETIVRGMQARRDGIAAAIGDWKERLRNWTEQVHQQTGDTNPDPLSLKAKDLSDEDSQKTMFPGCREKPTACEYWKGRKHVDSNIAIWAAGKSDSAVERHHILLGMIEKWQTKMDKDTAFVELDQTFPLPADLANSAR
jgi:hypothetical protein